MAQLADSSSPINCILVNSNLSYEEQNYHGFHELMHIYETGNCPGTTFSCYDKVLPHQNRYVEWIANEGAAELILPHDVLLPYIKECASSFDKSIFGVSNMINKISSVYGVSPMVVEIRISSLRYEIFQYLTGCDISEIKILSKTQQDRMGIKVDSLLEIEDRRFLKSIKDRSIALSAPFFYYSETYRGLLA